MGLTDERRRYEELREIAGRLLVLLYDEDLHWLLHPTDEQIDRAEDYALALARHLRPGDFIDEAPGGACDRVQTAASGEGNESAPGASPLPRSWRDL